MATVNALWPCCAALTSMGCLPDGLRILHTHPVTRDRRFRLEPMYCSLVTVFVMM
jgi:hypothetical protein